ncbi:hypothetical protein ACJJTC_002589, partial [Scirpophaga incertulas]
PLLQTTRWRWARPRSAASPRCRRSATSTSTGTTLRSRRKVRDGQFTSRHQQLRYPPTAHPPDDDIVEVPYQPKTPEIIDLDEYPESPQSVKKKKLDILKERGLEVTAVPAWPVPPSPPPAAHNPLPRYNQPGDATPHPDSRATRRAYTGRVVQRKLCTGTRRTRSCRPPHVLLGAPLKPARAVSAATPPQHILDLTCKVTPAVEIVKVPNTNAQNLTKNYTLLDGKAVVGSNLEITLVNRSQTPNKLRSSQKRSSNGKFVSSKTPTPPKNLPEATLHRVRRKNSIVVPNYQMNPRDNVSPTSSTGKSYF